MRLHENEFAAWCDSYYPDFQPWPLAAPARFELPFIPIPDDYSSAIFPFREYAPFPLAYGAAEQAIHSSKSLHADVFVADHTAGVVRLEGKNAFR